MFFVRSAGRRDLDTVSALLGETWHATYDAIYGAGRVSEITAEWHSPTALKRNLDRPNSEFIVADDGNTIAGMAYASMATGDAAMLHQLYVRPGHQGSGTGSMLLDEICQCFPEAKMIRLEVEAANAAAIAFYEHHGFTHAGATANCGRADSGIPALIFEKPLV